MSHPSRLLAALVLLAVARGASAERLFTLSEDGRTFLYRARPGDHPTAVAEMFGIAEDKVPAFLAANGIRDATRVGAGFGYRIPNAAANALGERAAAAEAEHARLTRELAETRERVLDMATETKDARTSAAEAEGRAARLGRLGRLWPFLQAALVLLVLGAAAAGTMASAALRRKIAAEGYARGLAKELDDKRRATLAERQENARRIVELETRVRTLEAQLGPRVVVSGRS